MLEEAPATLLRQAKDSFEIEPDVQILRRIEEATLRIQVQKNAVLEGLHTKISQLEKERQVLLDQISTLTTPNKASLEILNSIGDKEIDVSNETEGNIFLLFQIKSEEMDTLKVHYAKEMNSLESQINSMNIVILKLNEQLDSLVVESEHIVSDNILNNPDSKIMKINLYKSLGVLIEPVNGERSGKNGPSSVSKRSDLDTSYDKILIYNQEKSVTSILDATGKYSDYFVTNHIWENI